ncbi:phage head-tail joining protein [Caenispirillum bisanense]|uniref:phage head-tail joining protein n=1 Tax=Caenispirillum bisanense TaxID=414052 RepID=UPI0031D499C9
MTDLATLQAQRQKLAEARATGMRTVQYGDKKVEYRTDAELRAALDDLDRQIAQASGKRVLRIRVASSKGL